MIKSQELTDPNSCLNKSRDDEPLFVLAARDRKAQWTVRFWMLLAYVFGTTRETTINGADQTADEMDDWYNANMKTSPEVLKIARERIAEWEKHAHPFAPEPSEVKLSRALLKLN